MNIRIPILLCILLVSNIVFGADEIHWTFTGQDSITFDWRGIEDAVSFRLSTATPPYTYTTVSAYHPTPLPTSSVGPFWEAQITGLQPGTLYYYAIGNGAEHTFQTPPLPGESDFTVYVEGDVGSTRTWPVVGDVQKIIGNVYGNGYANFSLIVGDLSYADPNGTADVDQHFNDVMLWSQDAAYMPAWGNHEWDKSSTVPDNFYNYAGRFAFPNAQTSPGTSLVYNYYPGEDWYWFDYGNVRFVAYPELYSSGTRSDWNTKVQPIMAAAQADPYIKFIVTFGHSPTYSCSSGNTELKNYLDAMALNYSKYVLDLSGHHHFYQRSDPSKTYGVTHVIAGTGHTSPSSICTTPPSWSAFQVKQPGALKLHFAATHIDGEFICAPVSTVCSAAGAVVDSFVIGSAPLSVNITAPAAGATVSGTAFTVSASTSVNTGVAGVQFKLDGVNLGSEDTTAPYSVAWDTTTALDRGYALTAEARDTAGNVTTSSPVSVTVNNSVVDATPPTVSLSAPADGTTVSGSSVTVSASAADNFAVAGVQFKLDGANLGSEDTTAPYSISWDTATALDGGHALTAVALDATGNAATSSAVSVAVNNAVDTAPPTVSMTAPAAGATVSGTAATVSASASDNIGVAGVQFKLDGVNLGAEDTAAPYSISWDTTEVLDGGHTLTAAVRDAAGNITTPDAVSVTVDNSAFSNSSGSLTHQWKFDEISGTTALDSVGASNAVLNNAAWIAGNKDNAVSFNGTNASGDAGKIDFGTGNFTVAHWVNVNGFKNYAGIFNNRSSTSGNIGFLTRTDGTSALTALIDFGATSKNVAFAGAVTGTWYHVAVSVDRAGFMKLYVNAVLIGQADISAFSATSITNTDNVRLGRSQSSDYFNGGIDDLRIYNRVLSAADISNIYHDVDTTPPTVSMTAPVSGEFISGTVSLSATATDNVGVAGVQFKLDGVNLGGEVTTITLPLDYLSSWDTGTVPNGEYTLTAVARDAAGNAKASSAVLVTVDNAVADTTLPTVSMIAPASGASVSGTIPVSADAADNTGVVSVQFQLDGANLGAEVTAAPYSLVWDTGTALDGNHSLTAVARDAAGNTATSSIVSVTVNNPVADTILPIVSMAAPANGASVSGTIPVSADAADNIGIVGVQFQLDGANLGAEVTAAPYLIAWDTAMVLDGSHVLTAVARDAAGNTATSVAVSVTVNNPVVDTILPTVSLTAPANGASVSGTIPVSADAADNIGVVGVQFQLDGANLGAEVTAAPYSLAWDT
ncbi:MAG: Ig-like domain-containing protein, partial [Methylobacter sp.]